MPVYADKISGLSQFDDLKYDNNDFKDNYVTTYI